MKILAQYKDSGKKSRANLIWYIAHFIMSAVSLALSVFIVVITIPNFSSGNVFFYIICIILPIESFILNLIAGIFGLRKSPSYPIFSFIAVAAAIPSIFLMMNFAYSMILESLGIDWFPAQR